MARDERVEIRTCARHNVTLTEMKGVLGIKMAWRLRAMVEGVTPQPGTAAFHDWEGLAACDPDVVPVLTRMIGEECDHFRVTHILLGPGLTRLEGVPEHLVRCHTSRQTWIDALDAALSS